MNITIEPNKLLDDCIGDFLKGLKMKNRSINTVDGYKKDLALLQKYIEDEVNRPAILGDITTEAIEDYLKYLKEDRAYQATSVNRNLNTFRSFSKHCVKKKWTTARVTDPIEQVQAPRKERAFLNHEEAEVIIQAIDHKHIKTCVQTLYYTGLRITECLTLRLEDVNFDKNEIFVRNGKGNKERVIPIAPTLKPILVEYVETIRQGEGDSFFSLKKTGALSSQYVNRELNKITKKLGINKHITCHVFRHSFATRLITKDASVVAVQKLLGHSDIKTTSIYLHSCKQQLVDAVATL